MEGEVGLPLVVIFSTLLHADLIIAEAPFVDSEQDLLDGVAEHNELLLVLEDGDEMVLEVVRSVGLDYLL